MKLQHLAAVLGPALLLSACTAKDDNRDARAEPGEGNPGVARDAATPAAELPGPPAEPTRGSEPAIRTQPGPNATSVDLIRANVVGDVLTVALTYRKPGEDYDCCEYIKLDEVSVIDDATSQKIGVLKDDAGKWMAAPLNADQPELRFPIKDGVAQVWFKFPAPSAGAKTVSVNIPDVLPFDAVPVVR